MNNQQIAVSRKNYLPMPKKFLVKNQEKILAELVREVPDNGIFTVGNDASATLELKDAQIAPEQFVVVCESERATLMCSADGGRINDQSLPQGSLHELQLKDRISVGDYTLIFDTAENVEAVLANHAQNGAAQENPIALDAAPKKQKSPKKSAARPENPAPTPAARRSLNDVLEELRSDEKFYFLVENAGGEKRRFYVESEEMWLGWSAAGECVVGVNTADIEVPRAQIRKDWSGVVLYPLQTEAIRLNSETLSEPRRLKNDDRLLLLTRNKTEFDETTTIKFHEPTALLVLDSILPKKLPPPVSMKPIAEIAVDSPPANADGGAANRTALEPIVRPAISKKTAIQEKRRIFGYFTPTEIAAMIVATLIASVIVFFVLQRLYR